MIGDHGETGVEQEGVGEEESKKSRTVVNSLDLELNRERLSLHNEVVKWCTDQIKKTTIRNPLAPPDPAQFFKDRLCDLQIDVLNKSSEIAMLQSRLTEIVIRSPDSSVALLDLKKTLDSVQLKRSTNGYGYGQEVVNIACTTLDSVKVLVDQVGVPASAKGDSGDTTPAAVVSDPEPQGDKVEEKEHTSPREHRSQSAAVILTPKKKYPGRARSQSTTPSPIESSSIPKARDVNIRALSNL